MLDLSVNTANAGLEKPLKRTARGFSAIVDFQDLLDFPEGQPQSFGFPNEPDSESRAAIVDPVTTLGPRGVW
jgi:hypothetical protein